MVPTLIASTPAPRALRPRLIHIVGYALRGGCESCCLEFIRHEPTLAHHVIVLGQPGPMTTVWHTHGASTNHLNALELGWSDFHRRLATELAGETCAGVIVWAGIRVPLVLSALARVNPPTVIHAGNPFAAGSKVRLLLGLAGLWRRWPSRLGVVACSEHVARTFRRAPLFRQLPVTTCLNPVTIPAANPHRTRALAPGDIVRIGMVARLDPIKDHATLLRAFAALRRYRPAAELHLAGAGPLRHELEQLSRSLRLEDRVHFHGSIDDVPRFLQGLDLFCYVTTPSEGMGSALAEALAAGLPCVVNELPVLREVAGDVDAAARFAPADPDALAAAIETLLHDETERGRLSQRAWRRAHDTFSPRRVVHHYRTAMNLTA